jgi:hypothetical protein
MGWSIIRSLGALNVYTVYAEERVVQFVAQYFSVCQMTCSSMSVVLFNVVD